MIENLDEWKPVLGEIAIFTSGLRRETYVSQVMAIHLEFPYLIRIEKASEEQKKAWYENNSHELVLDSW